MIDRRVAVSSVGPKQAIFASLAEVAQALGHAHRLELLEHLGQGERSVEDLAARASLTFANTSRHLQILQARIAGGDPARWQTGDVPPCWRGRSGRVDEGARLCR